MKQKGQEVRLGISEQRAALKLVVFAHARRMKFIHKYLSATLTHNKSRNLAVAKY